MIPCKVKKHIKGHTGLIIDTRKLIVEHLDTRRSQSSKTPYQLHHEAPSCRPLQPRHGFSHRR